MLEALPSASRAEPRVLRGAAVCAVGSALPPRAVDSAEIAERLGVTARWIESRTGVRERRVAEVGSSLVSLAADAGREALEEAGVEAAALDLVVVATCTPDSPVPACAPLVAGELGAAGAGAFDVNGACTGFVAALDLACASVESGRAERVLVVGADMMSRLVDPDDRRTAALFGDGAGAVVVARAGADATEAAGAAGAGTRIGPRVLGSDASGAAFIRSSFGAASLHMDGHETFKAAVARLSEVTVSAAEAAGLPLDEVDLFVYHQANARILAAVGERLGLRTSRVVNAIGSLGNTSAASIPLALAAAVRDGRLRPGMRVLLAAFGAGFTWGALTLRWGAFDA